MYGVYLYRLRPPADPGPAGLDRHLAEAVGGQEPGDLARAPPQDLPLDLVPEGDPFGLVLELLHHSP